MANFPDDVVRNGHRKQTLSSTVAATGIASKHSFVASQTCSPTVSPNLCTHSLQSRRDNVSETLRKRKQCELQHVHAGVSLTCETGTSFGQHEVHDFLAADKIFLEPIISEPADRKQPAQSEMFQSQQSKTVQDLTIGASTCQTRTSTPNSPRST